MVQRKNRSSFIQFKGSLLGEIEFLSSSFERIEEVFSTFHEHEFRDLLVFQKHAVVSKALYDLICEEEGPCFLLPSVVDYISRVQQLLPTYNLTSFEFWLNQYSGLSSSENLRVRGKIAGKYLQREDYQIYFPIGLDKHHPGSHFVLAHLSPDIDTVVASYWGFIDAFAARVGEGMHYWLVPERLPENPIELELLFSDIFGPGIFQVLLNLRRGIRLTALDLMTQEGIVKKELAERSYGMEHERSNHAVVLVDDQGSYLGDWRAVDLDAVRGIIHQFNDHLRQMESLIHQKLISLFAKPELTQGDVERYLLQILHKPLTDSGVAEGSKKHLDDFIKHVLNIEEGHECTFEQFVAKIAQHGLVKFTRLLEQLKALSKANIFDGVGKVIEDRPKIFALLEQVLGTLSASFLEFREYIDTLGCGLEIKHHVFGHTPHYLGHLTELSEIQEQMKNYTHMTVNYREPTGTLSVMGAVFASSLQKSVLATASLRDFGNFDEAEIPPYVVPISVLDHHRVDMKTPKAPRFIVADVQSSNVLVGELAMKINDRYSTGGMSLKEVDEQLKETAPSKLRILQRLLQRKGALSSQSAYFVSLEREFIEYLHFLYAILDDTDFLVKVTLFDVECVAALINRLKSLSLGKEVEVIDFDDIPRDAHFVENATKKLQKNEELYSLYKRVYKAKELLIEKTIAGLEEGLFQDTKIQNGCSCVGQFKMFKHNLESLKRYRSQIHGVWVERSQQMYAKNGQVDLHLFMLSTLTSAEELHLGHVGKYEHKDELCCWYPVNSRSGALHLKLFLQEFFSLSSIRNMDIELEVYGKRAEEFRLVAESAMKKPFHSARAFPKEGTSLLVIKVDPGSINSRKAKITPCLPWN